MPSYLFNIYTPSSFMQSLPDTSEVCKPRPDTPKSKNPFNKKTLCVGSQTPHVGRPKISDLPRGTI
jgi:hypothetical protein